MALHDFQIEIDAARKLKEILDKEEGALQKAPLTRQMSNVVMKELFGSPRSALSGIYEKLEILKSAGWDVERQSEIHKQQVQQLDVTLKNMKFEDEQALAQLEIEQVIAFYREFLYLLAFIDNLKSEVDSMCRNHMKIMDKLSP